MIESTDLTCFSIELFIRSEMCFRMNELGRSRRIQVWCKSCMSKSVRFVSMVSNNGRVSASWQCNKSTLVTEFLTDLRKRWMPLQVDQVLPYGVVPTRWRMISTPPISEDEGRFASRSNAWILTSWPQSASHCASRRTLGSGLQPFETTDTTRATNPRSGHLYQAQCRRMADGVKNGGLLRYTWMNIIH